MQEDDVLDVMKKINKNQKRIMFAYKNNPLLGLITNGDVRKYLIKMVV